MLILLWLASACKPSPESRKGETDEPAGGARTQLDQIRERGVLRVVTEYNSISYFIYKGQPVGFQYELLQELANYMNLELEVKVSNDLEENFADLERGDIDLIAMNLTVTADRKEMAAFSEPILETRQVLVQRKPELWEKMNARQIEKQLIRRQLELRGKTVYVQAGSVYACRLKSLSDEIGGGIEIREVQIESEQLVQRVATGEIDYAICDENVGLVNTTYFPQLDVSTPISFAQQVAWALPIGANSLKAEINAWLRTQIRSTAYVRLKNRYFRNRSTYRSIHSENYTLATGRISPYDKLIRAEGKRIGWDWRLLASMIYQESRFNPEAVSWAGAFGLMQLMPVTARRYGVTPDSKPAEQIRAGTRFIKWLDDRFFEEISDRDERQRFVMASYNIGYGHIQDARRLARKHGDNPNVWFGSVEEWLLKKADPAYYQLPVVKYGYARGIETYHYVREVSERYEHYQNIVNADVLAVQPPIAEIR